MSLEEAVSLMRGPEGEPVILTIQRGDEEWDVAIVRAIIEVPSVERWEVITSADVPHLNGSVGYVQLSNFNEKTMAQMNQALSALQDAGVQGLVLDLRNNGGGLLTPRCSWPIASSPRGPWYTSCPPTSNAART